MTLVNRMSKVVLMPECGDLVVRPDGSKYVVTSQSFDDDTCAMSLVRSQAEHPATRDQLTQLGVATDDQLRAECERRFGPDYVNGLPRVREANLIDERDEWKRRAEAAEAESKKHWEAFCVSEQERTDAESSRDAAMRVGKRAMQLKNEHIERGIAALKPDTARWGPSDEDLLADDAEPKR